MKQTLASRLRRLWLDVHLWIGVGLLVLLIPLGVSGSLLVWHDALDRTLYAERYAVTGSAQLPAEAYAAAAQAAFGARATLSQIRLPQEPGDPVVAVGRLPGPPGPGGRPRSLNAWIDPPSARVLATAEPAKGVTMTLHRLHGTLMIPEVGRKVVGWLGWAMFVSSATGLWLWWPRHGGFLRGLRWRRGASQLFNLHHTVGFWICLPLAVLSLTGVFISFPQTAQRLFGGPAPRAERPAGDRARMSAPPLAAPATSLQAALEAARADHPQARVASVNWPQAGKRPAWRVELKDAGPRPLQIAVDDATGRARPAPPAGPQRSPLATWMRRIHDGTDLGLVWQTAIFLGGVAPAILGVTGVIMWLRRSSRRRRLAQLA